MSLCLSLGVTKWIVALAVLLVDTEVLVPFAATHPELWHDLCGHLKAAPDLRFMRELFLGLEKLPLISQGVTAREGGRGTPASNGEGEERGGPGAAGVGAVKGNDDSLRRGGVMAQGAVVA